MRIKTKNKNKVDDLEKTNNPKNRQSSQNGPFATLRKAKNRNVQLPFAITKGSEVHAGEEVFRRTGRIVIAFPGSNQRKKSNG